MKLKFFAALFAFVSSALIAASPASAQIEQKPWANVEAVKINSALIVETKTGAAVKGRVASVTPTTLNLSNDGRAFALERADIARVYRAKKSSRLKRALIGAGIGLGIGVGISVVSVLTGLDGDDPLGAGAGFIYGVLVGVPAGAVIGAATAKSSKGVLLYETQ